MSDAPVLVADIGGSNARFALARIAGNAIRLTARVQYRTADFDRFDDCLAASRAALPATVAGACLAVAGPVGGQRVQMTNVGWTVDGHTVSRQLATNAVMVINDFAALGLATLDADAVGPIVLQQGRVQPGAPRLVLGPGTGLGVAAVVSMNGTWQPVCGEGGHMRCPRHECLPSGLWEALDAGGVPLTLEHLLSGRGMVRIYRALCRWHNEGPGSVITPSEITAGAIAGTDPRAGQAMRHLCNLVGCVARDLALAFGAAGGVYLAGGILPRIVELVRDSELVRWFGTHATHAAWLAGIPLTLMTSADAALIGAGHAWWAAHAPDGHALTREQPYRAAEGGRRHAG